MIDMSPLIDCIFILLIFFIVTTTFVEETGIEVDKPQAASAPCHDFLRRRRLGDVARRAGAAYVVGSYRPGSPGFSGSRQHPHGGGWHAGRWRYPGCGRHLEARPRSGRDPCSTPPVVACMGLWFSAAMGSLSDDSLDVRARAAPRCLWRPLKESYAFYATLASSDTISPEEAAFNEQILAFH